MYKIIRFYYNGTKEVIEEGVTLEEAREYCSQPESSSRTSVCEYEVAFFDGYEEE